MRNGRTSRPASRGGFVAALFIGAYAAMPASALAQAPSPAPSPTPAVDNWADLRRTLTACWSVPPDTDGSLIAFRFGLDKTGALRGRPLVTARDLTGDRDARERYETAAADALARCLPVRVTAAFGAVLGESPIRLRFINTPPTAAYQLNSNITIFAPP